MKNNLYIDQKKLAKYDGITLKDAVVINYIYHFSHSRKIEKIMYDGEVYYWFSYKHLMGEMPLLGINNRVSMYNIFEKLEKLGFVLRHPDNQKMGKTFFAFGNEMERVFFGDESGNEEGGVNESYDGVLRNVDGGVKERHQSVLANVNRGVNERYQGVLANDNRGVNERYQGGVNERYHKHKLEEHKLKPKLEHESSERQILKKLLLDNRKQLVASVPVLSAEEIAEKFCDYWFFHKARDFKNPKRQKSGVWASFEKWAEIQEPIAESSNYTDMIESCWRRKANDYEAAKVKNAADKYGITDDEIRRILTYSRRKILNHGTSVDYVFGEKFEQLKAAALA